MVFIDELTSQQKLVLSKFGLLRFRVQGYGSESVTVGEPLAWTKVPMRYLKPAMTHHVNSNKQPNVGEFFAETGPRIKL